MTTSHIIANGGDEIVEVPKIVAKLREKYATELNAAPWWRKPLIHFRIHREAARIYRHRLYSQ